MKMNFIVVSSLISSSPSILIAGYIFLMMNLLFLLNIHPFTLPYIILSILVILLSLIHHYIAIRVSFDKKLLNTIHSEMSKQSIEELTQQLDQSLISLHLMPKSKASRHWNLRLHGCIKLFKIQIALFLLQISMFIFCLFIF